MARRKEGTLRRQIKQIRPFRSRREEGALVILRTAGELRRRLARTLKASGLSLEQYNALRILRGAGPNGLPTLEVAARMIEHSPAITRLLDKLEAKGLAQRLRCEKDRRRVYCVVTPAGLRLLEALDEPTAACTERFMNVLPPGDLDRLIAALDRIRGS